MPSAKRLYTTKVDPAAEAVLPVPANPVSATHEAFQRVSCGSFDLLITLPLRRALLHDSSQC
jgi:hypothetical protein